MVCEFDVRENEFFLVFKSFTMYLLIISKPLQLNCPWSEGHVLSWYVNLQLFVFIFIIDVVIP